MKRAFYILALFAGGSAAMWFGLTGFMRVGDTNLLVLIVVGFPMIVAAGVFLHVADRPRPPDNFEGRAHIDVDWSVSDVCLRVSCPCTPAAMRYLDGYTFGRFRCPACGTSYRIVSTLPAYRTDPARADRELRPVK